MPPQKPPNPRDNTCDWCAEEAVFRFEIKRGSKRLSSQMYMFACVAHKEQGERATAYVPRTRPV